MKILLLTSYKSSSKGNIIPDGKLIYIPGT